MSNKPWQCQSVDYWADNTIGILKHVNKLILFIFTRLPMLVYSLYFHDKKRIVFL